MRTLNRGGRNIRQITALAIATTFLTQNFAWAVCSDGTTFPAGNQGFVYSTLSTVAPSLANMSPNMFTGTAGSVFIPDNSSFENNNSAVGPSTIALDGSGIAGLPVAAVGGHNWVFDQGSCTSKATDTGPADQPATGWTFTSNTTTDCILLPVVKTVNGQIIFTSFGVVPLQSQAIVFTCDPTALATAPLTPNPRNTRLNQIGCSIQRLFTGAFTAADQTTGPAYLVVSSINGGLFTQKLDNTPNNAKGDSGRVISELRYFNDIPDGTKLTNAAVSPDGHYVIATSIRRNPNVWMCNMPFGDPGRIDSPPVDNATFAQSYDTLAINPNAVKCLTSVATTGLSVTLSNLFGPDGQPYVGGQSGLRAIGANPGSIFLPSAWPQCIAFNKGETFTLPAIYPYQAAAIGNPTVGNYNAVAQLDAAINDVVHKHSNGGCAFSGNVSGSPVVQPQSLAGYTASNGHMYMFSAGLGQPVEQVRITQATDGTSHYTFRNYFSGGTGFTTGVGVVPDMSFTGTGTVDTAGHPTPNPAATGSGSLIVMTDSSGLGLAGQEVMSRLPLCEDF